MAELIASGKHVGAVWTVTGFGPWLDILQASDGTGARNNLMRSSLVDAGKAWAAKFLGRRFTNYVRGSPFFYSLGTVGAIRKFRRMGLLQNILDHEFFGWDPWSHEGPPKALIQRWRQQHPETRGAFSRSGNYLTLSRTIRSRAKEIVWDYVNDTMNSKLRPLVETGEAEKAALSGYTVRATATLKKQILRIGIPLGNHHNTAETKYGINAIVGNTIRRMPDAEVAFLAKAWAAGISARLRGQQVMIEKASGGTTGEMAGPQLAPAVT